jgi:glycolate oxidase FAD binding subunit
MLAVNESGPLRLRCGTPAEYVDRVAYVDAAGVAAESDGEEGRPGIAEINGLITSATVRLEPLPEARRWVGMAVATPLRVLDLVAAATTGDPLLSAVELDLPGRSAGTLAALFEGTEAEVIAAADRLAAAWGAGAVTTPIAPRWWGRYPFGRSDVALRLSLPAADLPSALYTLGDAAGAPVPVRGSAGLGTVHAVLPGDLAPDRLEAVLETLRHVFLARNGRAVVVSAPPAIAAKLEMANRRDLF